MSINRNIPGNFGLGVSLTVAAALALSGCGGDGAAVDAVSQTISFAAAPTPAVDQANVTVSATASSGLPVTYSSTTPSVCSVDSGTGAVTGLSSGTCVIAANQAGNSHYAPAAQVTQSIVFSFSHILSFTAVPSLSRYDLGTITAVDSSGAQVTYTTTTPAICAINATTGLITALAAGNCSITATAGALQATRTIAVTAPSSVTVPGTPSGVTATLGSASATVTVAIGAVASGGRPITGYTVTSSPAGITATNATIPITVTCPSSCAGYSFSVAAANATGTGTASAPADIITGFNVLERFYEPDTQPNDSIFTGSFTLNSTTGTISNLKGKLSESMTGGATGYPNDTMTWLTLNNQLVSWHDAAQGGTFAAVFRNTSVNTFFNASGTDYWSPQVGVDNGGIYYGFPTAANNPGNAYALIFVPDSPLATLTQAQINKLAYADCAPGGMMGAACMTGTSSAGYGATGTMSGYPVSQTITKQ